MSTHLPLCVGVKNSDIFFSDFKYSLHYHKVILLLIFSVSHFIFD